MLRRVFLDHPHEVGETYGEHFRVASGFASELLLAGLACAVHAVAPCFCKKTGSQAVASLHDRMIVNRCPRSRSVDLKTQSGLTGL